MPTLPAAKTRLAVQSGRAPVATDLIAVIAPVAAHDDGVPRLYSALQALLDKHLYSEGAEYGGLHIDDTGKGFLYVPVPIATPGAIGRTESVHTGTSRVTAAVGANGALAEVPAILNVVRGGVIGTDQILLELSLDGGTSFKPVRLGTATSYVIPNIGVTVSFGAGTLVTGDTCLEFKTSGPMFDATGVALAKTKLAAQQKNARSWIFIGDVLTLALGQAIETAVNAYETGTERYVYGKFQTRDRRVIEASRVRHAMVGGSAITFAEVGATGDTITRGTGSFVTDGFAVGDYIRVLGSASNNVSGKITAVSATVLTLDTADLTAEVASAGAVSITGEASYVFATTTITRSSGSWVTDGFKVGDEVTIDGSASNDGTAIITALSATVMTCGGSSFVSETAGSCSVSVTFEEAEVDWINELDALFAPISSSERVDIGLGRLTHVSAITGYTPRWPVQWADSIRSFQNDLSETTWEKAKDALDGWGIDGEHDEKTTEGALAARFTCARTWKNGPEGAFIAMSVTRAEDGSILGMTHNMAVANLTQTVVQRETEAFVGGTYLLNDDGTMRTEDLAKLKQKVDAELARNIVKAKRASSANWTPATDDDLSVAGAELNGVSELNLKGTIVKVNTKVKVR